ncbi:MAG: CoA-binding protein [Chloroflexi bacterium]|nr:CoA-binding protein [Chloroflexota bacterium]
MDRIFHPRCVVVIGDKKQTNYMWLRSVLTLKGHVYSVQINKDEWPGIEALGVKNYSSILDIPEPVDYVIVAVPRTVAHRVLEDCIRKQVGAVMFFTSGFAETGTEEGIRLQNVLGEMARKADLYMVGPNCMGIYNPEIGLRHHPEQYCGEGGEVGFISQSGTHATQFSLVGYVNGIKVSKSVSYGNGIILDSTDYLEYLGGDEDTRAIGMYIEGVKDGRRFFRTLKEVARAKPVVIWKGGQTEDGARAASSHTGSLTTSVAIWDALIKQCGAIRVDSFDELLDVVKALLYIKHPHGERVGLMAMTGGQSVVISDAFAKAGLKVPKLSEISYKELASFFNIAGGSYMNPLDVSSNFSSPELVLRMLNILGGDENVDTVAMEISSYFLSQRLRVGAKFTVDELVSALTSFRGSSQKPFFTILTAGPKEADALSIREKLVQQSIPTFPTFQRGANALKKLLDYTLSHAE